jgi:hypothetical protein
VLLRHSALALDAYTWLAHRLCRISRAEGVKLSWANLQDQFGVEYSDRRDFKKKMRSALRMACSVYPAARVEDEPGRYQVAALTLADSENSGFQTTRLADPEHGEGQSCPRMIGPPSCA